MDPFAVSGRFCFPDHIFPAVDSTHSQIVPTLPTSRVGDLEAEFQQIIAEGDAYPSDKLMRWVQRILKLADLFGLGSPRAIAHAKHILEVLHSTTSPYAGLACYLLGCWHQTGVLGYDIDKEKARILLRRAIKLHYSRAWYRIAFNAESRGDNAKALSRYKQGAALDDAACLYRLSIAYFLGQFGFEKDVSKGFAMLDIAAQRSDSDYPQPAFLLGKLCLGETELIPGLDATPPGYTDRARGIDLMRKAAFLDFSPALMRLADAYQGEIEFDSAVTLRFLHISARQERYLAYTNRPSVLHGAPETLLVKWLLCGFQGVFPANEEWAFNFAKVAASLGSGTALFAMGYFYEVGIVANIDWGTAQMYYQKSAAAGCVAAKERLKKAEVVSREPSLRRQLTRIDHERTLSKYRAKMGQNNENQPLMMAINPLDSENSPEPTTEPMSNPPSVSLIDSPVLAPIPQSPPKLPYPDEEEKPQRRSFFGAAKNILSNLPYPRSPDRKSRSPSPTRSRSTSPSPPLKSSAEFPPFSSSKPASPQKLGLAPSLPYPDDAPPSTIPPYPESPPPPPPVPTLARISTSPVSARISTPVSARISTPLSAPVSAPVLGPPSMPTPVSNMDNARIPYRQQAVRRKPVARAVSGPEPEMAPHKSHHARSATVSADIHAELRNFTPSPTQSSLSRSSTPQSISRSPPRSPPRSVDSTASASPSKPPQSSALTGPKLPAHRKYGSVAVVSSSPPRPERRFASSPVARRPGVAYSFEEMGVPVIAGDNSGKCIIS